VNMKSSTKARIAGLAGAGAVGAAVYVYTHRGTPRKGVGLHKARKVGEALGVDWTRFEIEEFHHGMEVELEHGRRDPATDVTGDDLLLTGKIALAHLNEFPDYYTRLTRMEEEAKAFWSRGGAAGSAEHAGLDSASR
jgi:hypothetical protein